MKNACSTSRSGARAASSAPTSNGPEVPSPMAGMVSPRRGNAPHQQFARRHDRAIRQVFVRIAGVVRACRGCAGDRGHAAHREKFPSVHVDPPRNCSIRSARHRFPPPHRCRGLTICSSASTCGSTCVRVEMRAGEFGFEEFAVARAGGELVAPRRRRRAPSASRRW